MSDVVIVTGGSRGIGAATARLFAHRGWSVCIGFHQDQDAADKVVADCEAVGVDATAVMIDLAGADVAPLFAAADQLGPLAALVNNAGITAPPARVDEMTAERVRSMFEVNVVAAFLCAGEAVRRMSTRHGGTGGCIVNLSSGAARIGSPGEYVDYAASKGAIDTLTLGLAKEVAEEGIRVNAVRPGLIDTDIHASGGQPDKLERVAKTVPMKRPGRPEEIAEAIVWLCSPESSYVTAALMDVTGGR